MSHYRREHLLYEVLRHLCIVVKKDDIRGPGGLYPFIYRPAETIILREFKNMHPGITGRRERTASIRRAVVNQYYFKIICGLAFQTVKHTVQESNAVIIRYDHRYFHNSLLTP